MKIGIVIPAHNEAENLSLMLNSLLEQTYQAHQIVIVDDNSTDATFLIASKYTEQYPQIQVFRRNSDIYRLPGAKVVQTFNDGLSKLAQVDLICKFDADLIFPDNYLETIVLHFRNNPKLGMCGGFCSIKKDSGKWEIEDLTDKNHLRGAIKSYRNECFEAIGDLKEAMGWDTVDELLARYYGWEVKTDTSLLVKHLRPTGAEYSEKAQYLQGEMFYRLRYGFWISLFASLKLAFKKRSITLLDNYLQGYFKAKKEKQSFIVTHEQGVWIRKYRWENIFQKIRKSFLFS
ncbi:glycosyltransferase family 2 protein [Capnocytophaga catalasegens]|uniref:Glycosyl transferase family 2 n=1 Tax=Capnocytophaga catalasegens TaxID=1004260 RepID=A0AAV5AXG2_9FLAO|nr:glycosyltransferase family A protein [Capnocytophaga catalasegens]GIZ15007.1 glycosyl transferase family 2 [Capnocytophaga catalasegens]GJM49387.1 glycosyl transferase family 2 [Capnocytophaga catalasegens]GJM52537.1 glycosyl transferase family 2 [Capnocytophaga catalasegens]